MTVNEQLAAQFGLRVDQVEKTVALIDEGNTIPFISRYRKEVTGGLDDTVLRDLNDRLVSLRALEKRKEDVFNLISSLKWMTSTVPIGPTVRPALRWPLRRDWNRLPF